MSTGQGVAAQALSVQIDKSGWQRASLGKLLPIKYGKSLPAKLRDITGSHPVFGSSGIVGTHSAALTTGPTLIVGRKGNVGAIHYSTVPCWPIDTAYFVEAPAGHNLRYYKYLLESLNLARLDRSTAIPGLSRDDYNAVVVSVAPPEQQDEIVAEIEKQFSRLDEAVANLKRVKANLKRYEKATIESLTNPETFDKCVSGTIFDIAISLDNMRKPVNKAERVTRPGNVPYLGANGQTGWIDDHLFDEEIVLVVEDETFVGRTAPFSYYFAEKCWVNNHTHVLRARPEVVSLKYLNLALSYYPFTPMTTGSTGRRKLTKGALMVAPIVVPAAHQQMDIVSEVERRLSLTSGVLAEVEKNLQRAERLRHSVLANAFGCKATSSDI